MRRTRRLISSRKHPGRIAPGWSPFRARAAALMVVTAQQVRGKVCLLYRGQGSGRRIGFGARAGRRAQNPSEEVHVAVRKRLWVVAYRLVTQPGAGRNEWRCPPRPDQGHQAGVPGKRSRTAPPTVEGHLQLSGEPGHLQQGLPKRRRKGPFQNEQGSSIPYHTIMPAHDRFALYAGALRRDDQILMLKRVNPPNKGFGMAGGHPEG